MRKVGIFAVAVALAGSLFVPLATAQVRQVRPVRPKAPVAPVRPVALATSGVTQDVEFGGASSYRYLIPVKKAGGISISATWRPASGMEAYLYSPKQKTPVASAKGTDTLKLSRTATAGEAGKNWMLEIKTSSGSADTRGKVKITWPGDAKSKITWQDGLPTDPKVRAYFDRRLESIARWKAGEKPRNDSERAMWALAGKNSGIAAGYRKLSDSLAVRKEVVSLSPGLVVKSSSLTRGTATLTEAAATGPLAAGHTTTYVAPPEPGSDVYRTETEGEGLGPMLRVRFLLLRCYEECTWDRGSDSDEPYLLMGIVTDGGTIEVTHSRVLGDVDSGERRPNVGVSDEIIWEGRIKGESCFALALMERDSSKWGQVTAAFEDVMTDAWAEFSIGSGGVYEKSHIWQAALTFGMNFVFEMLTEAYKDDKIGAIQSFVFTEQDVQSWYDIPTDYGNGNLYTVQFQGDGANYSVMLKFGL